MPDDDTLASGHEASEPTEHGEAPRFVRGASLSPEKELQLDKYRILQRIGTGGMGDVFEAQQLEPVRRRVALKVIKRGMDTDAVVARFESERQALALMDHECIAKVFDGGATPDGRPYFAMEYVKGIPITEYCDKNRLGTKQRLELFLQVCEGVQHAHQKGIIHRDIKPSNVLVTVHEAKPVPKIIDFGLAKATAHALTERTLFTELGQLVGTPEYMSPEQAEMSGLDVDTRTDVYSLGVLLYELLVGTLPFDPKVLRAGSFEDIRRKIRDEEPQKPSTRLVTVLASVGGPTPAPRPRPEILALSKQLRGDLDWIVMTAMEKDRTRRYASASDLAADIVRHLRNEPVLAGAPSSTYRMKKFVLRHKVGVATAAAVMTAVVLGMIGTTVGLLRARAANRIALEEATTARQISDFMVGLFRVADPESTLGNTITAREILDQGASRIEHELHDQPLTQARLLDTMGNVFKSLGLYGQARPLLELSYHIRRGGAGSETLDLATTLSSLGDLARLQGNLAAAESLLVQALAAKEKLLGPGAPEVASTLTDLGVAYTALGKFSEAETVLRRSLAIRERVLGPEHADVAESLNYLGVVAWRQGRYAEALPLFERAIAVWEKTRGGNHPDVARGLNNLGLLYGSQGKYAAAVPVYERAVAIYERTLGPDHIRLAQGLSNLGLVLYQQGDYAAAAPLFERALRIMEKRLGPDHPSVATTLNNLANLKKAQKDDMGAEVFLRRALDIRERALGPDHPDVAWSVADLGVLYRDRGDYAAAEPLLRRALATFERLDQDDGVAWTLNDLGILHTRRQEYATAENDFKRALATFEVALGDAHPDLAACLGSYAALLRKMGRPADAEAMERRAADIRAKRPS